MSAEYFVVQLVDAAAFPNYTAAVQHKAKAISAMAGPQARQYLNDWRIMLDVTSVNDTDFSELLMHDPMLSALFKVGYNLGFQVGKVEGRYG